MRTPHLARSESSFDGLSEEFAGQNTPNSPREEARTLKSASLVTGRSTFPVGLFPLKIKKGDGDGDGDGV